MGTYALLELAVTQGPAQPLDQTFALLTISVLLVFKPHVQTPNTAQLAESLQQLNALFARLVTIAQITLSVLPHVLLDHSVLEITRTQLLLRHAPPAATVQQEARSTCFANQEHFKQLLARQHAQHAQQAATALRVE